MVAGMNSMCAVSLPERTHLGLLPTWRPCRGCPHRWVARQRSTRSVTDAEDLAAYHTPLDDHFPRLEQFFTSCAMGTLP
jgi:hypothetical protein